MVTNWRKKQVNKILRQQNLRQTSTNIKIVEKAVIATIKAVTNDLLEEATEADFGYSDRGEQFLDAVPVNTIIRIHNKWLE